MKKNVFISMVLLLLIACGKDKFETKPQLKLISISHEVVPVNSGLNVTLEFTDKQGDVSDTLFITKQRLNARTTVTIRDTILYPIPDFPKTQKGEFELSLDYQNDLISALEAPRIPGSDPVRYEPDTLLMKFVVQDNGGNKSDSVLLNNLVILR